MKRLGRGNDVLLFWVGPCEILVNFSGEWHSGGFFVPCIVHASVCVCVCVCVCACVCVCVCDLSQRVRSSS